MSNSGMVGASVGTGRQIGELATAAPDGSGPDDARVLTWSGPGGWRARPPQLVARAASDWAHSDDGFTFVELMIALLVMAILLAIAIPAYLGTTATADNRSAQSNLNTALTDAKAQFENHGQTYLVNGVQDSVAMSGLLTAAQLSLSFHAGALGSSTTTGSSGSQSSMSVAVSADGMGIVIAAYSTPGNCYYIVDNEGGLSTAAASVSPYVGAAPVTTSVTSPPQGSIALPSAPGMSFVEVKGDVTANHCNAFQPMTSGAPITVRYLKSGFPF